jgi:hypothetical protein
LGRRNSSLFYALFYRLDKLKAKAKGRFTLDWYKERNGDVEGERLYEERRVWLKSRNLKKDENARFLKAK